MDRKTAAVYSEKHVTFTNVTQRKMLETFFKTFIGVKVQVGIKDKGTTLNVK
jgi:hypothetical protein